MIALIIPWFLLLLLIIVVLCLILKKRKTSLLLLVVIIGINWWGECIPIRFLHKVGAKKTKSIKVLSFNIDGSSEDILIRLPNILNLIKNQDPDVVFIAEYPENYYNTVDTLVRKIFDYSTQRDGSGHYFFSKYPLSEQQKLCNGDKNVGIYSCIMNINRDTVRLYGCHFASNNYTPNERYITPDSINNKNDLITYIKDIQHAYYKRIDEAGILVKQLDDKGEPIIVMGDFNDVSGSAVIKLLEKTGLKDAWWEGGVGYGATIHTPLPYRIDHIMYSSGIELRKIDVISSEGLSDHDALYAEFGLKAN